MQRKLGEFRVIIEGNQVLPANPHGLAGNDFLKFISNHEPNSLRYEKPVLTPNPVLDIAKPMGFQVNRKKDRYYLSFGWEDNQILSFQRLLDSNKDLSKSPEEILEIVKRRFPTLYEIDPAEDGTRMFCLPITDTYKGYWPHHFADREILVSK